MPLPRFLNKGFIFNYTKPKPIHSEKAKDSPTLSKPLTYLEIQQKILMIVFRWKYVMAKKYHYTKISTGKKVNLCCWMAKKINCHGNDSMYVDRTGL